MSDDNRIPFSLAGAKRLYALITGKTYTATDDEKKIAFSIAGAKKLYAELANTNASLVDADELIALSVAGSKTLASELMPFLQPDEFTITQWDSITIPVSQLTSNDYFGPGNGLVSITFHSPIRGTVVGTATQMTFTSTGMAGEPAGFKYTIKDRRGYSATTDVTLTVTELPELTAYISTKVELTEWMQNFVPPSQSEIFNTWGRFSNLNAWYPQGTTPAGESTKWELTAGGQFRSMINSTQPVGLVSPKSYDNYTIDTVLSVDESDQTFKDDDQIGLVLGFSYDGEVCRYLALVRAANPSWDAKGNFLPNVAFRAATYIYNPSTDKLDVRTEQSCPDESIIVANKPASASLPGWEVLSPTRVRVVRTPTGVTCSCSPWNSTDLTAGGSFKLDFVTSDRMSFMTTPRPYGFFAHSQYGATWSDIDFNGGDVNAKEAYDFENNVVWQYVNTAWVKTTKTIQDAIGYPRTVKSATTGKRFRVTHNSIVQL